ncbi:hypothetical protein ANCDUO_21347, partial [Ancylostoma duodenale]
KTATRANFRCNRVYFVCFRVCQSATKLGLLNLGIGVNMCSPWNNDCRFRIRISALGCGYVWQCGDVLRK